MATYAELKAAVIELAEAAYSDNPEKMAGLLVALGDPASPNVKVGGKDMLSGQVWEPPDAPGSTKRDPDLVDSTPLAIILAAIAAELLPGGSLTVQKGGVDVGTRAKLNLIEGSNVTITAVDNSGAGRVDVTIASAGAGGGSITEVNGQTGPVVTLGASDVGAFPASGVSTWGATLVDDTSSTAGRATLGLGNASTKDVGTGSGDVAAGDRPAAAAASAVAGHVAETGDIHPQYVLEVDLPAPGVGAGDGWSPIAAGALTVDAQSAAMDPTLAVVGDTISCSGYGGFATATGPIPAVLDLHLDDASTLAVGYGVGAAVGIPDGASSVWACVGIFRVSPTLWRLMLVSHTNVSYFWYWNEIGSVGYPYPDFASPPLRVRWDHGAGCIRVQLADSSWISYGPIDELPPLAPRVTQSFPTAWGIGLLCDPGLVAASSATVRLFHGADDGDVAWLVADATGDATRQPVPAVLSVAAAASGGASRSLPVGAAGADVFGAATPAAGRTALALAAIAASGSAADLSTGVAVPERIASGTPATGYFPSVSGGSTIWRQAPHGGVVLRRNDSRLHPVPLPATGLALTTGSMAANILRAVPLLSASQAVLEAVGVEVTTLNAAATIRLGVYADDGTGYPGALIQDLGTVSPATIGVKIVTALSIPVPAGQPLWIVFNTNSATTCRALALGAHPALLGMPAGAGSAAGIAYTSALAYASGLPATFPAGATVATAIGATPFVRFSS